MIGLLLALFAAYGLLIGSFLNVVIYRVPNHKSVVSPPSSCPNCAHRIAWYDNIPVLSWAWLRGHCRNCNSRISARYPIVEAGTSIFFVLVGAFFLPGLLSATTALAAWAAVLAIAAFLYLAAISVVLALIDLDVHRLPNAIVVPSYVVGGVLLGLSGALGGDWSALITALIAGVVLFAIYLVMALAYPRGMGFGDVKLAGLLGLFLGFIGWGEVAVGAFAPFVLGGLFALFLLATKRAGRKSGIPFGPWMLAGAWVGIFFGDALTRWYLALFGLA